MAHRDQWRQSLGAYAAPLRELPVDEIDMAAVLAVLKPLWARAPETASRLRGKDRGRLGRGKVAGAAARGEPRRVERQP
jgi:hypothetical protein